MRSKVQGFTLIELVTVIVIIGILATMTTNIITLPVRGYVDLARRTTLVDNAETALRLMQRDVRRALPNSLRVDAGSALEMLHTSDGGRYRARKKASDGSGDILDFTLSDNRFDVIGALSSAPQQGDIVVYNLGNGVSNADAYAGANRAALAASSTTTSITLSSAKQFPLQSPQQRFFIVDTPVSYSCDNGSLWRYSGYSISSAQSHTPSGTTGQLLVNQVSHCVFTYNAGTATHSGLLTLQLTLSDDSGESVTLLHQIHVDNMP